MCHSKLDPPRWLLLLILLSCFSRRKSTSFAFTTSSSSSTTPAQKLRSLITTSQNQHRTILLPGVHDALTASIFQQTSSTMMPTGSQEKRRGIECLFLSGFGVSASYLGRPDAGILTLNEMEDTTRRVVQALQASSASTSTSKSKSLPIPLLVDGDTGYGGCSNMRRAIRGLAAAGAAAVSIEDQIFPKRCTYSGSKGGVGVISRQASIDRMRTALVAAKEAYEKDGNEILIIARTDCRASTNLQEAMSRCLEYEQLGADIVYAENLQSPKEYQQLRDNLAKETPTILAQVQLFNNEIDDDDNNNQKQRLYSLKEIQQLGYNFGLFGVTALQSVVQAIQQSAMNMLEEEEEEEGAGRPREEGGSSLHHLYHPLQI